MNDSSLHDLLWYQFGAALDMLERAMMACPDETWGDQVSFSEFWYYAYHTLFWTDFYLSNQQEDDFQPPAPFTVGEFEPDVLPERVYSQAELIAYLEFVRAKARAHIASLTPERMETHLKIWSRDFSSLEWLLYNLRHVQHHAAQLNLLLRQAGVTPPSWVSRTAHPFEG